jgi:hypothetical protein
MGFFTKRRAKFALARASFTKRMAKFALAMASFAKRKANFALARASFAKRKANFTLRLKVSCKLRITSYKIMSLYCARYNFMEVHFTGKPDGLI